MPSGRLMSDTVERTRYRNMVCNLADKTLLDSPADPPLIQALKHPSQHIVTRKQLVLDYREYVQHH